MFFQTNNKIAGPTWDLVADFHQVFQYDFMTNAFIAGTVVAILAGVVGYFVVLRRLSFACEALSHGGFAGATGAVVLGQDVFLGLLVFTSVTGGFMGLLGDRIRGRDVAIGGTLAFSLALGSLFLTISTRFAGQAVNILFGNVLAISSSEAADIALASSDIRDVAAVIDQSRSTLKVVRQNYGLALGVNSLGILIGALGALNPVAAAVLHNLSTLAVVANSSRLIGFQAAEHVSEPVGGDAPPRS